MNVSDRVKAVVADALYLEADEVKRESSLMKDLGAESIDFLDIVFRLEKEFSIKLPKGEIEKRARGGLSEAEFSVDGKLTPEALVAIQRAMPEVNAANLKKGMLLRDIPSLFTVSTFERMVNEQLFGSVPEAEAGKAAVRPDAFPASRV